MVEGLSNAVGAESVYNCQDISVLSRIIVSEEAYHMHDAEVVVEEKC